MKRPNMTVAIDKSVQDILAELFGKIETLVTKDVKQMKSQVQELTKFWKNWRKLKVRC